MTVYKMHLHSEPFELIKSGKKKVEARLLDEKRAKIKAGDFIEFINRSNDDKITCKVISLYKFPTFVELYKNTDRNLMGYIDGQEYDPKDLEIYYSLEEQKKFGVVAIYMDIIR